jgi:tripartite-type tricarboxylate transporter receptor subunit TctC
MERRMALTFGLAAIAVGPKVLGPALGESRYPERPIKLIVPFAPGGLTDLVGRPWADKMKTLLGPVVVEHQPGAGGAIGAAAVARAAPDGYTLLLGSASQFLVPAAAQGPYDPIKDFVPISILVDAALTVAIHPAVPARTLQELIDYAKANPGKVSYGSGGVGSSGHVAGELLKALAGTAAIVHVPYKGAGRMITDLVSGHVPMLVVNVSSQLLDLHQVGKLRMLAVTTPGRVKIAPDVPTAAEAGLPGMVFENFTGLFTPAGTPRPIVDLIVEATRTAMADDEFREKLIASGFEPYLDPSPDMARRFVEEQVRRWTPVIKSMGLKLK